MAGNFDIFNIYEQNLNFLFGAGASCGFLPTLALKIKDEFGISYTFETLAKVLDERKRESLYSLLFMYYYKKCILPGLPRWPKVPFPPDRLSVIDQYKTFLKTLISLLDKQDPLSKKCNIYTTNYDSCFEIAADDLLGDQLLNFAVNDGAYGFQRKSFHTKNFNNRIVQKGIFDRHAVTLPQVNILHPHGSVYWKKTRDGIDLDYGQTSYDIAFDEDLTEVLEIFQNIVENPDKSISDVFAFDEMSLSSGISDSQFWTEYKKIPIVNPTKWKFYETVFEEAYYQILRHLSFELEKPNTILITFGFSFADEHILHLIQRSLSNPSLTIYISCFNQSEKEVMQERFKGYKNVEYIFIDDELTFERFNKQVFTLEKKGSAL